MKGYRREHGAALSEAELAELRALEERPIDTSDIPELPEGAWKGAAGMGKVLFVFGERC